MEETFLKTKFTTFAAGNRAAAAAENTIYLIHCHKIIEKLKSGDKFPVG